MADESLIVTEGAAAGTRIALEEEFRIGRTVAGEGRLGDDPELSREHARVVQEPSGGLQIEDFGSTNGTFVNGKRISGTHALKPGDTVKVGTTTMQVLDATGRAPAATRFAATPPAAGETSVAASPPPQAPASPPPQAPGPPPPSQPQPSAPRPQPRTPFPTTAPTGAAAPPSAGRKRGGGSGPLVLAVILVLVVGGGVAAALYFTGGGILQGDAAEEAGDGTVRIAVSLGDIPASVAGSRAAGGSGVVIDEEEGLVLTNEHVIRGGSAIEVFKGSERASGRVMARAPCDDLALLQVEPSPSNVSALTFGDAEDLEAGQRVFALGFPLSLAGRGGQSRRIVVTEGPVSVPETSSDLGANLPRYRSVVQHQAPISPGNSGGPLVNEDAEVVGINTLGDNELPGQSYGITSNYIEDILPDLREGNGRDDVGWALEPTARGPGLINVDESEPGSPADRARIGFADLILSVGGSSVSDFSDVCRVLNSRGPGDRVAVRGVHASGRSFSADLRLRSSG